MRHFYGAKLRNSLHFSLLAGNSRGEKLAPDCMLRHAVWTPERFCPLCTRANNVSSPFAIYDPHRSAVLAIGRKLSSQSRGYKQPWGRSQVYP
jgi:hypothetical protein